jgi:hypothetical protein
VESRRASNALEHEYDNAATGMTPKHVRRKQCERRTQLARRVHGHVCVYAAPPASSNVRARVALIITLIDKAEFRKRSAAASSRRQSEGRKGETDASGGGWQSEGTNNTSNKLVPRARRLEAQVRALKERFLSPINRADSSVYRGCALPANYSQGK